MLIGVQPADKEEYLILLNPGSQYIMKTNDICFYLSVNREEDMTFMLYRDNLEYTEPTPEEEAADMMEPDQTLSTVGKHCFIFHSLQCHWILVESAQLDWQI